MKDLSRQKFEESWRQAFDGAEVDPPVSIWSDIELDIVHNESDSMRKKVVFYKWLAAASVVFVVFLGAAFYYVINNDDTQLAVTPKAISKVTSEDGIVQAATNKNNEDVSAIDSKSNGTKDTKIVIKDVEKSDDGYTTLAEAGIQKEETQIFEEKEKESYHVNQTSSFESEPIALVNIMKEIPAIVHGKIVAPRLVLPAMPAVFMNSSKKNISSEDLWASVGFSAGSYNPGLTSSSSNASNSFRTSASDPLAADSYSDHSSVGSAYSTGFAMSKRVFSRLVLQSGLNYINQNIGYTSNFVSYSANNQSKVSLDAYAANQSVTITSPYKINSAVEVISFPIQTGYLVIDRKIGWQLNTGVAADFFIRNTLTDESGNAQRLSQGTGGKSPYKAVSWAGLLGTELSYKVAKQYRISIVPGMRYSVNSVLKSTAGQTSNPLVMDIGFRFRYIFR